MEEAKIKELVELANDRLAKWMAANGILLMTTYSYESIRDCGAYSDGIEEAIKLIPNAEAYVETDEDTEVVVVFDKTKTTKEAIAAMDGELGTLSDINRRCDSIDELAMMVSVGLLTGEEVTAHLENDADRREYNSSFAEYTEDTDIADPKWKPTDRTNA